MLKRLIPILLVAAFILPATSCHASKPAAQSVAPAPTIITSTVNLNSQFSCIDAGSIFDIEIKQGPQKIEITSTAEMIEATRFSCRNQILGISLTRNFRGNNIPPIKISITVPNIHSLIGNGAAKFSVKGKFGAERLTIRGAGAATFNFSNLTCTDLSVNLSGASTFDSPAVDCDECELKLSGGSSAEINRLTCTTLDVEASGAGNVTVGSVICNEIETEASGGSNVNISSIDATKVECESSGAANIVVSGKCENAEYSASGASKISARNLNAHTRTVEKSGVASIRTN